MPNNAISSELLRRLAAAIDGVRTGEPVYLVAAERSPHQVLGAYSTEADARAAAAAAAAPHGVHGPYATRDPEGGAGAGTVEDVVVTVRLADGTREARRFAPDQVDALFLNLAAVDKFLVPYYAGQYGVAEAVSVRGDFVSARVLPVGHGKYSWPIPWRELGRPV